MIQLQFWSKTWPFYPTQSRLSMALNFALVELSTWSTPSRLKLNENFWVGGRRYLALDLLDHGKRAQERQLTFSRLKIYLNKIVNFSGDVE